MELALTEKAGDAGRKIHTARSRNDQVATLLVLFVIESGEGLIDRLGACIRTACHRAVAWSNYAMPLQTHAQFATPGNAGFWLLRYATAMDRIGDHARYLVSSWRKSCPLGSGAVAGSSVPVDRSAQAKLLGFERPSVNALASTSTRDECLEYLCLAAQTALHLQSFATDVIAFSQTPFGWTIYPATFGTGSSMMPNKRNPDAMELLRGECAQIVCAANQAMLLMKGLPSGYNRDLQCLKPAMRDTSQKLDALLAMTTAFLNELDFDRRRLEESLDLGQIGATLAMEHAVLEGATLRDAHHATAEALDRVSVESARRGMNDYRTSGSAHPDQTRQAARALLDRWDT